MKIELEYTPYPLPATTPYSQAKEYVTTRYAAYLDQGNLKRKQKDQLLKQFISVSNHVKERLEQEQADRLEGKPHANIPYHAPHMWQACHDGINVGRALIEKKLVPEILAYQTPRNALTHDLEYLRNVTDKYPTYAHNIQIHVAASIGQSVRLFNQNEPLTFLTDQERMMSLQAIALEIHGTHFPPAEEVAFHTTNRLHMIEKFANIFGNQNNYEEMKLAAEWLCKGARLWDFWGQLSSYDYMRRLPDLQLEMNAATPGGQPLKGDQLIGTTDEERSRKSVGFIQYVALEKSRVEDATALFGQHNNYSKRLQQLTRLPEAA